MAHFLSVWTEMPPRGRRRAPCRLGAAGAGVPRVPFPVASLRRAFAEDEAGIAHLI